MTTESASRTPKPLPMQVLIVGRIESMRRYEKNTFTRVLSPAPDPYSRPQTIDIRSKQRIGQPGEEISVVGKLGGYPRKPYRVTDKETGEIVTVQPVEHTVDLVE